MQLIQIFTCVKKTGHFGCKRKVLGQNGGEKSLQPLYLRAVSPTLAGVQTKKIQKISFPSQKETNTSWPFFFIVLRPPGIYSQSHTQICTYCIFFPFFASRKRKHNSFRNPEKNMVVFLIPRFFYINVTHFWRLDGENVRDVCRIHSSSTPVEPPPLPRRTK